MNPDTPIISIIIVSYNTRDITIECLRALISDMEDFPGEIWIVDNASNDGTPALISDEFPQVKLIENVCNIGFGAANNQAMSQARGSYFLLLNSDAFVKRGTIRTLVEQMGHFSKVGVLGPQLLNWDGTLQQSCYPYPTPLRAWMENLWISTVLSFIPFIDGYRHWMHDTDREVDTIIGACMLVRREAYEQVGGFDERFFMYSEEVDWQRRMRSGGWKIRFTSAAQVTHLGGGSGITEKARINNNFFESLDRYVYKHHRLGGLISFRLAMVIGSALRTVMWALTGIINPGRRKVAIAKQRFHYWLFLRQLTNWSLKSVRL